MTNAWGGKRAEQPWRKWRHVVKLDPDKQVADELLAALGSSGTDAVFLGGTQGVTGEKVNALYGRLQRFAPQVPVWQEISGTDSVIDGIDGYAVPVVLNAGSPHWLIGAHKEAILKYRPFIDWSKLLVEGYLVLNPDSAVAEVTEAQTSLTAEEAAAYAVAGEELFSLPVIYVEYSGTYGDPAMLQEVTRVLRQAHVFYGGGIDGYEKAWEMGGVADTIVVGNALYEANWREVLRDTVRAVKGAEPK
ncbi:MAG TPA: heptaprenylglyceryl phosphate synthase [Bacilli bacterium]|nr:heptaprenylglyceryl phosphate synthase [Bacilli bacterium]